MLNIANFTSISTFLDFFSLFLEICTWVRMEEEEEVDIRETPEAKEDGYTHT